MKGESENQDMLERINFEYMYDTRPNAEVAAAQPGNATPPLRRQAISRGVIAVAIRNVCVEVNRRCWGSYCLVFETPENSHTLGATKHVTA